MGERSAEYTLDLVGNRLEERVTPWGGGPFALTLSTYDDRDRLTNSVDASSVETWNDYDANGALLDTHVDGTHVLHNVWDGRGRVVRAERPHVGDAVNYTYTAEGIRSSEVIEGGVHAGTRLLLIEGQSPNGYAQVIEERTGDGHLAVSYVHGLEPISRTQHLDPTDPANQPLPEALTAQILADAHSGTRQLITIGEGVIAAYQFGAFGTAAIEPMFIENGDPVIRAVAEAHRLLYRGEWVDRVTGQYNLRARIYDPVSGRFLGMDPYNGNYNDPAQIMRYGFAGGNPLFYHDPSGRMLATAAIGYSTLALSGLALAGTTAGFFTKKEPGFLEGFIPGWGAGRSFGAHLAEGSWWAALDAGFVALEIFGPGYIIKLFRGAKAASLNNIRKSTKAFFSVQDGADAARLLDDGIPWPTLSHKAHLGPGLYSWGSRSDAANYLLHLQNMRGAEGLKILSHRIRLDQLSSMRVIDLTKMSDEAVEAWVSKHSSLLGVGEPHDFQYVIRQGFNEAFGPEHYFSSDVHSLFITQVR